MRVMLAQVNPTIGDYDGNLKILQTKIAEALQNDCDVILFPELVSTGYPPRDLLYQESFWKDHEHFVEQLHKYIKQRKRQITVIFGGLHQVMLSGGQFTRYNAAWILDKHEARVVHKKLLPCYDVFDETRYFKPDHDAVNRILITTEFGAEHWCDVLICEDIWNFKYRGVSWLPASYNSDPVSELKPHGDGPIFILNASPFWVNKTRTTYDLVEDIHATTNRDVFWCNQVGAHDDIITGGYSMAFLLRDRERSNIRGTYEKVPSILRGRMLKHFEADMMVFETDECKERTSDQVLRSICNSPYPAIHKIGNSLLDEDDYDMWTIYKALCLHLKDYCRRTGFQTVVFGSSGGIDSAVVGAIAAHALGSANVSSITMPSPYSSEGSWKDSKKLADNLKIYFDKMDISELYNQVRSMFLSGGKQKFETPVADENIQPRLRAILLMTFSNEFNALLLTTGNKSEIAVGYCTIYGDTCGGLSVISDLWKTQVYELARFINKYFDSPIPEDIVTKPPSAELRPDQKDTDSLPDYDELDPMLRALVEEEKSPYSIAESLGVEFSAVQRVYNLYRNSEYKRQQMPPGPKVQERSFGSGRRIPIAKKMSHVSRK